MSNSTLPRWKLAFTMLSLVVSSMSARTETLLDIYELALENDAQLKAQEARYLANIENKNVALSALLPQVRAGYGITGTDAESLSRQIVGFTPSAQPIIDDGYNRTDVETEGWDFALAQPLFDLGAWYSLQAGQEFSKQAEAEFASATQNLIVRTVEAYLGVLRAQDNLAAAEAAERAFSRQLEQTQQRFEVGLIAITDVYESEAARDLAEVQRIVEENNVAVAKERLSILTGQDHGSLYLLSEDFEANPPTPADRAEWVQMALVPGFRSSCREQ